MTDALSPNIQDVRTWLRGLGLPEVAVEEINATIYKLVRRAEPPASQTPDDPHFVWNTPEFQAVGTQLRPEIDPPASLPAEPVNQAMIDIRRSLDEILP